MGKLREEKIQSVCACIEGRGSEAEGMSKSQGGDKGGG